MKEKRTRNPRLTWRGLNRLAKTMDGLIAKGRIDEARRLIKSKEPHVDNSGQHRLSMWSAKIEHRAGNRLGAITILRNAIAGDSGIIPHLAYLADYLIEEGMLQEAISTLDRLITESEECNDSYFLDDARLRKMYYLRKLGRHDEIGMERAKLPDGIRTVVDGGWVSSGDFD